MGNDTLTFNLANLSLIGTASGGGDSVDAIPLKLSGLTSQTIFVNSNAGTDTIICTALGNASLFGGQGVYSITANGSATKVVGRACTPIQKIKSAPKMKQANPKLNANSASLPPQGAIGVEALGHRQYVGGMWEEIGLLQFNFLKSQGIKPTDTFLDIACGALRLGIHLIPYLEKGHYLGIEKEQTLINAGLKRELGESLAEEKEPILICDKDFSFDKFGRRIDMAIAQSLFTHLSPETIEQCMKNLKPCMNKSSVFYATYFESQSKAVIPSQSHDHGYFAYTKSQMLDFGNRMGFDAEYLGDWKHPRSQVMVAYRPSPEA